MKKRIVAILLVLTVFLGAFMVVHADENTVTISILGTNDIHSHHVEKPDKPKEEGAEATSGRMGLAKLAAYKHELEKDRTVFLFDAGDTVHGQIFATMLRGESMIWAMNEVGYDAMTAGNHDFNYGYEQLIDLAYMADFPILAANVIYEDSKMSLLPEYAIIKKDGIKVGVFGLATPETLFKSSPKNTEGLIFVDPAEAGKWMSEFLRPHVDLIVCLGHLGIEGDYTSMKVAEAAPEIDILIDGHSHTMTPEGDLVNGVLITQAGEHLRNFDQIDVVLKPSEARTDKWEIVSKTAKLVTYADVKDLEPDAEVIEIIEGIESVIEEEASQVIGHSDVDLDGERETNRAHESNLGDLLAEAMLFETGADVAFTNGGGIRASIPAGDITLGQVGTTLPFANFVQTIEITGDDLMKAIEHGVRLYPELNGGFPQVAGMSFKFDPSKEAYSRVVELLVAGEPVDLEKTYVLATNDFMAIGGDEYTMFKESKYLGDFGQLDEVLAKYLKEIGSVSIETDGRIQPIE